MLSTGAQEAVLSRGCQEPEPSTMSSHERELGGALHFVIQWERVAHFVLTYGDSEDRWVFVGGGLGGGERGWSRKTLASTLLLPPRLVGAHKRKGPCGSGIQLPSPDMQKLPVYIQGPGELVRSPLYTMPTFPRRTQGP